MNFSSTNLKKLETLIKESSYSLRYEKGNFNSGYCILKDKNVIIINKYFTDDVKFLKLMEIILTLELIPSNQFSDNSLKIIEKLKLAPTSESEIPFDVT